MPKRKRTSIIKDIVKNPNKSWRKHALKRGISRSYVRQIAYRNGFRAYKRKNAPLYSEKQKKTVKTRLLTLQAELTAHPRKHIIIDDETYFALPDPKEKYYRCSEDSNPNFRMYISEKGQVPFEIETLGLHVGEGYFIHCYVR